MRKKIKNSMIDVIIVFFSIFFKYISIWFEDFSEKYIIIVVPIIISIVILLKNKYYKIQFKKMIFMFIISIYVTIITKEIDFILSFMLALIFLKKEYGDIKFIKCFTVSSIFCYISTIVMNYCGIIDSADSIRYVDGVITQRRSLGFSHVNEVFKLLMPIIFGIVLLLENNKDTKKRKIIWGIIFFIVTILYIFSNCRTGYLIFLLMPIIYKTKIYENKNFSKYYYIIFLIISVFIGITFKENNILNKLLSNRPYLWNYYFSKAGITLFGTSYESTVDNVYLWILLNYGIIVYYIYFKLHYICIRKNKISNKLLFVMLINFIYQLMENMITYSYNFIFIVELIYILNINTKMYFCDDNRIEEKNE